MKRVDELGIPTVGYFSRPLPPLRQRTPAFKQLKHILDAEPAWTDEDVRPKKRVRHDKEAVSSNLKRLMWDLHVGMHIKSVSCFGCGRKTLYFDKRADWEASHVVARHWFKKNQDTCGALTKYDLVPLCRACNLSMRTQCLWEWLYEHGRIKQLKRLCHNIYKIYTEEHAQETYTYKEVCWRLILEHLHGQRRFPNGGVISQDNYGAIRDILKLHQQQQLEHDMKELIQHLGQKRRLMQTLLENR